MSTLGKRLDQVRQTKEMTLEEFGTYLGYGKGKTAARQVMSRMINDHRLPTLENLKKTSRGRSRPQLVGQWNRNLNPNIS